MDVSDLLSSLHYTVVESRVNDELESCFEAVQHARWPRLLSS